MIRSIRRAQEFAEFTIGEWRAMEQLTGDQEESNEYRVKIKIHKTMQYGSAEIYLNDVVERAHRAYMLYARPTVTKCSNDSCKVFITSGSSTPDECCIKLPLANVSGIVRTIAVAAVVSSVSVNTRLLRRSTIASAWQRNSDPSFRQELHTLAGHSYETARRYYAVYDTEEHCRRVVHKVDRYRNEPGTVGAQAEAESGQHVHQDDELDPNEQAESEADPQRGLEPEPVAEDAAVVDPSSSLSTR